ncbi:Hypothetical protein FKW44_009195, partial [Caligus rogercresseyi]
MANFGGHEDATLAVQRATKRVSEYELFAISESSGTTAMTALQSEGIMFTDSE